MRTAAAVRERSSRSADAGAGGGAHRRGEGIALAAAGVLGLLASWVIAIDEFKIYQARAAGETFTPSCSLNPVVACGSVMESEQAHVFGVPNPFIRLVCYALVVMFATGLIAGVRYPTWLWVGLGAGSAFGVSFCAWLQFQSLFRINALCLWCCLVWTMTIFIFSRVALHFARHGAAPVPRALRRGMTEFPWALPTLWSGLVGVVILVRWWDFWTG
jgi:uncharacterized membrane protein